MFARWLQQLCVELAWASAPVPSTAGTGYNPVQRSQPDKVCTKLSSFPRNFYPPLLVGIWTGLDFGVLFFFYLFCLHVVVELSFCYMHSRVQECVSFSRLENAQRYNQVLPQYLIIHN